MGPAPRPVSGDLPTTTGDGSLADTVLVSNRGPLAFRLEEGRPEPVASGGGLAGSLLPLIEGTGATWVACTMNEADRKAAAEGLMETDGLRVELVEPEPDIYNLAYNVVSNATLWFCHHHLFDSARRPRTDRRWMDAWDAYRAFNRLMAERVAEVAPVGGRVLVQDYHLALMAPVLAELRPDLATAHFTHTPFADPSVLRMLPTAVGDELLDAMSRFGSCGFHSERWAVAFRAGLASSRTGGPGAGTFVAPLSSDADRLRASAAEPGVAAALNRIEESVGGSDRQVIVRVDRMELSKNLLRGFWAFDDLLEQEPAHRERVVFVALAYPTRQGLPEYLAYQDEVETTVARINERWGTPGWTPVVLEVEDDYPRSLAALTRYDVLLVNPVRDGLNLVAMEGPVINTRDGVLALSREAGAFDQLAGGAIEVNPFDVTGTATILARALALEPEERTARAAALRAAIAARRPTDWLADQLAAARPATPR
ncbi:MAG TPA: trehalose-6-phosphate synthase [Acidimicrobiales bacterium]